MSLFITSLNSGSNGNCYYIGNDNEAVLVDAGLSCRETVRRMSQRKLDIEKVKAIFVSHEHNDHINGLSVLSRKYKLPVYITDDTLYNCPVPVQPDLKFSFEHAKTISIGSLQVLPFVKSHDADDPYSFIISHHGVNVGVITDIGYACKEVMHYFSQCHAVFLESNYCPEMLANGIYPPRLQKRISSDRGHLSNHQALELFVNCRAPFLNLLVLSHLSKNNNSRQLVKDIFEPHSGNTEIFIASRYEASPVFSVRGNPHLIKLSTNVTARRSRKQVPNQGQLSLF